MSPSKAWANKVERTPTTNDIVLLWSPATWTPKDKHGTKIYEQWLGPKKRDRVNNLVRWDRGWWHKYTVQSKQARVLRYKSQLKTRAEPMCRSRHCAVKNTRTQQNRQKLHSIDTFLKHTTFPHLWTQKYRDWILILQYNCIGYRNAKTWQNN